MKTEHFVAIARLLKDNPEKTQRLLAKETKMSLGLVNSVMKECIAEGYLRQNENQNSILTPKGERYLESFRVKTAIILAAGFGSRFVPLSYEMPKGLLEVHGQPMVERQIELLHEKGVADITIVVGYKKEMFDYLIDKYGVKLIVNNEYHVKNNLSSLYRAVSKLGSTYLLMSDHYYETNFFNTYEANSWLSCRYFDGPTDEWCVNCTKSGKIEAITIGGANSYAMIGPAYFSPSFSKKFRQYVNDYYHRPGTSDFYWEHLLKENINELPIFMNNQDGNVHEFENLEELRLYDPAYNIASNNHIMATIARVYGVSEDKIKNIAPIKVGMTNRSFTFTTGAKKYIMRMPGEGTDRLINRHQEFETYQVIKPLHLCDNLIYIDPETGYKISEFMKKARVCDAANANDLAICMKKLKEFHKLKLKVAHRFDPFERIEFYESLWLERSAFRDYQETKKNVMRLKAYLENVEKDWVLAHIDAVPDNFLIIENDGAEEIKLIDWEYAGMQDPHIDIAMFVVYAMYERQQADDLIDIYFEGNCPAGVREKIYAYIAVCGLLWSNWCEYKRHMGVEFGEYALWQYRYAKDYYRIFYDIHKD